MPSSGGGTVAVLGVPEAAVDGRRTGAARFSGETPLTASVAMGAGDDAPRRGGDDGGGVARSTRCVICLPGGEEGKSWSDDGTGVGKYALEPIMAHTGVVSERVLAARVLNTRGAARAAWISQRVVGVLPGLQPLSCGTWTSERRQCLRNARRRRLR